MTNPTVASPNHDFLTRFEVENTDLLSLSQEELDTLALGVSSLKTKIFTHNHIIKAATVPHQKLLSEVVSKTMSKSEVAKAFDNLMECRLGYKNGLTAQSHLDVIKTLLPHIPKTSLESILEKALLVSSPQVVSLLLPNVPSLSNGKIQEWLATTFLRTSGFSKPRKKEEIEQNVQCLVDYYPSLFIDDPTVLYQAFKMGISTVRQIAPYVKKDLFSRLLVRLLIHERVNVLSTLKEVENYTQTVSFLYEQSKETFLKLSNTQLDLFLPREENPLFWSIHDQHRLQDDLKKATSQTSPLSTFPKKM